MPATARADAPKRQRIRKDVRGAVEEHDEERPDRERDRERRTDPADRGASRAIRLDREKVGARTRGGGDEQADDEREQEARATDAGLGHRPGAGGDQERHEHAECDQFAEREVHDARQLEDEGVADGDDPVDGARGEPAREHLQDERHGETLGSRG